ncbi:hypothetical protein GUITHDRAFT_145901 [Guillardia theta CCMP2712]|uniref:Uncharacterized protein n=1 Tax=Guillardia theta (strain CCMP2712) TaxID=905079 RepID=L1IJV9_GUITC|nr:hypothetical protein GUITHDRAFT_145901 [Guillardia theta CCMP2712]EKX36209.1 hypothetical protein GUITHDRAFT_145901 [Guillardia theta CCMP2712]|eukprot:XP_005823189.1 hypothetical protein GUITHDRAFT_145901 [Guillardia theta CCMP2712]
MEGEGGDAEVEHVLLHLFPCDISFHPLLPFEYPARTPADLRALCASYKRVHLFLGNGPRLQYEDVEQVWQNLTPVLRELDEEAGGPQHWLAVFGGDSDVGYGDPAGYDMGRVMAMLRERRGTKLLAVVGWDDVDAHVDFAYKCSTTNCFCIISSLLRYNIEIDEDGKELYGGLLGCCLVLTRPPDLVVYKNPDVRWEGLGSTWAMNGGGKDGRPRSSQLELEGGWARLRSPTLKARGFLYDEWKPKLVRASELKHK